MNLRVDHNKVSLQFIRNAPCTFGIYNDTLRFRYVKKLDNDALIGI